MRYISTGRRTLRPPNGARSKVEFANPHIIQVPAVQRLFDVEGFKPYMHVRSEGSTDQVQRR